MVHFLLAVHGEEMEKPMSCGRNVLALRQVLLPKFLVKAKMFQRKLEEAAWLHLLLVPQHQLRI
jgi:hypothetical protein